MDNSLAVTEQPEAPLVPEDVVHQTWDRFRYGEEVRGHRWYCAKAQGLEGMYLGAGLQFTEEQRRAMEAAGKPVIEFNEIMPAINAAIGYQIHNRMDISFRPRGGKADAETAADLSKIAMQIADRNRLPWIETQVFADGIIQRRGYYEVRVEFDRVTTGEVRIYDLDPLDVIPDPDAKTYDPDGWADVIVARWLTLDEIEGLYGPDARQKIEDNADQYGSSDFGEGDAGVPRNKFAERWDWSAWHSGYRDRLDEGQPRVRVVDRQRNLWVMSHVEITEDGTIALLRTTEDLTRAFDEGRIVQRRMIRRVKWIAAAPTVLLHHDWSPYDHLTVVPFFPFFRRGVTRSLVDAAVDPQIVVNKAISQEVHILNTVANSGWVVQAGSLTNMTTADLEQRGAESGLILEYAQGAQAPQKIQPNQIPAGVDNLVERGMRAVRETTVPEAMRGIASQELTGVAIQSRQFAAQQQLAVPLDNLKRTRELLASRILELVQGFYTDERVFLITETNAAGKTVQSPLVVNRWDPQQQTWLHDITVGEYDVVIAEQPMQVTFDNSQLTQALELRKEGIRVPDSVVIRHTNLDRKEEIIEQMDAQTAPADPLQEAKTKLTLAQADKAQAETVSKAVEALYSAGQTAATLMAIPHAVETADALLKSAGFVDRDGEPLATVPSTPMPRPALPHNTDPLTPANPDRGMEAGIRTPEAPG